MSHRHFANIPNSCHKVISQHINKSANMCFCFLWLSSCVARAAMTKKSNYMEFNIFHKKTSKKQGGMPENFLVSMFLHFFNIKTLKFWNAPQMNECHENVQRMHKSNFPKTVVYATRSNKFQKYCFFICPICKEKYITNYCKNIIFRIIINFPLKVQE